MGYSQCSDYCPFIVSYGDDISADRKSVELWRNMINCKFSVEGVNKVLILKGDGIARFNAKINIV
ncbi:hypothetical protein D3C81_2336860 [compost metagenome]